MRRSFADFVLAWLKVEGERWRPFLLLHSAVAAQRPKILQDRGGHNSPGFTLFLCSFVTFFVPTPYLSMLQVWATGRGPLYAAAGLNITDTNTATSTGLSISASSVCSCSCWGRRHDKGEAAHCGRGWGRGGGWRRGVPGAERGGGGGGQRHLLLVLRPQVGIIDTFTFFPVGLKTIHPSHLPTSKQYRLHPSHHHHHPDCHWPPWSSWRWPLFRLEEKFEEKLHVLRYSSQVKSCCLPPCFYIID